jgi:hypothetical protein
MSRRWWMFAAVVAGIAFLAGVLLANWRFSHQSDALEHVTFGGVLHETDYAEIRQIVAEHPNILDRRISRIEVISPREIRVITGVHDRPLSGGSDVVHLMYALAAWRVKEIENLVH